MFCLSYFPSKLKTGYTIPIIKKNKDQYSTDSYRGITVTPIIGKLFEHVLIERIHTNHSELQFGFTKGKSPAMAALLATEAIAAGLDQSRSTYVAALDVQKAFDVVSHPILKARIYSQCEDLKIWSLMAQAIEGSTRIRVNGQLSKSVSLSQGVGQGRIISTSNYKTYINPLLDVLQAARVGVCAGPLFIGAPT